MIVLGVRGNQGIGASAKYFYFGECLYKFEILMK